jgi:hypothetical protein
MPNSSSKVSQDIHDQYYTTVSDAEWCLKFLRDEVGWDLKGTALEPCVGTGSFLKASENLKLGLKWSTNDFFPSPEFEPQTQEDIRTLQPAKKPNFIITNPPFGKSNSLARNSLKHCLTICDKVAMILPKGARRLGFMDAQPDFAHLVADVNIPDMVYDLPTGEQRVVSTCLQVWEVKKTKRRKIRDSLDLRTDFVSWWCASKPNFADDEVKQSGGWISVRVNDGESVEKAKEIIASVDVMDYLDKSTAVAAFDPLVWLGRVNNAAVAAGRLSEP